MLTVAPASVAALAALLGWSAAAGGLLVAGLFAYAVIAPRVGYVSGAGDQWVLGGALAISALACGNLAGDAAWLEVPTVVLWLLAVSWVPVLFVGEVRRPRLDYDARRWATVFPVGMDAAATLTVARLVGSDVLTTAGRVWAWVALALWAVVASAAARSAWPRPGPG